MTLLSQFALPAALLVVAALALALWGARRRRRCAACQGSLQRVPVGTTVAERLGYEVFACTRCSNVATVVNGSQPRYAYCPNCMNRSLSVPALRLPDGPSGPRVEVHEACEVCGYATERVLGATLPTPRSGKVLPFRGKAPDSDPGFPQHHSR